MLFKTYWHEENYGEGSHGDPLLLRDNTSKGKKFPKQRQVVPAEGTLLMRKSKPPRSE